VPSTLINPYLGPEGVWARGNLHCHTKEHSGCASVPLMRIVGMYRQGGSSFLAVTDHDHVTDLAEAERLFPDIVFLRGFEYSSRENVLFIGRDVPPLHELPQEEAFARADGLLTVICHPKPSPNAEYWTVPMIRRIHPRPLGMEVYNGHYNHHSPVWGRTNPLYTDMWDELLTLGCRLWGFANDDFHEPRDFGRAFNVTLVEKCDAEHILAALKAGRFYATTGLLLEEVSERDGVVSVRLASESRGRFVGPGGRTASEGTGTEFSCSHRGEAYLRFEAESASGRIFLQPFFSGT
jgi:hypothetical protein